jgi:hypothetical protein
MMSTSSQLWLWEHAEYVFGALVAIACIGEYLAEFDKHQWVAARKDGIAKRSTLLLIAALAFELICLIRTNQLSVIVIGSLGQKAEEASSKGEGAIRDASSALSLGKDALAKAGAAQQALSKAENEANQAQTASSNALTLARGARQEADSFENEIASAKEQAAGIAKQLAPRTLNAADWQAIGNKLKPFAPCLLGRKVTVSSYSLDAEGIVFSLEIIQCLTRAGIGFDPVVGRQIAVGMVDMGVKISGPTKDKEFILTVGNAIHDRADTDVYCEWDDSKYKELSIAVGARPVAGLPQVKRAQ